MGGAGKLVFRSGRMRMVLVPELGGSIARLDWVDGQDVHPVLRPHDDPDSALDMGSFPLVPYCNRIRGGSFAFRGRTVTIAPNMAPDPSPLHGTGWLSVWDVAEASETRARLVHRHAAGEWPWAFRAEQSFTLSDDALDVTLSCINEDAEPMPCGLGQHPYFPCTADTRIDTDVRTVWTVDANVLPIEEVPATGRYDLNGTPAGGRDLDNGYGGWSGAARFEDASLPFTVTMSSPDAGFFQLYSPPSGDLFVAEPVSHANAALNEPEAEWPRLGLRVLAPGETMRLSMRIAVTPR